MGTIKCMFWNVRNLTLLMSRKGKQGGRIKPNQRINAICKLMSLYDINFLLETGDKILDEQIKTYIRNRMGSDYRILTVNTYGESYFIVHKKGYEPKENFLFGLTSIHSKNIRQGFCIRFNTLNLFFAVIHSPSPSMRIDERQMVMSTAKEGLIRNIPINNNIVFFGDFNFKSSEYPSVTGCLAPPFIHAGPFNSSDNSPLKTSLRTFRTILKVEEGKEESQSYDQVWIRKALPLNPQITVSNIQVPDDLINTLSLNVTIEFIEKSILADFNKVRKLYSEYLDKKVSLRNIFKGPFSRLNQNLKDLLFEMNYLKKKYYARYNLLSDPIKEAGNELEEILLKFSIHRLIEYSTDKPLSFIIKLKPKLSLYQYDTLNSDIVKTVELIKTLSLYLDEDFNTPEKKALACFEYGMSDHFPVEFKIEY